MIRIHLVSVPMGEKPSNGFSRLLFLVCFGLILPTFDMILSGLEVLLISSFTGALNVTVSAQAEQSLTMCGKEVVSVPARGRIDIVTNSLLVLVSMC